MIHVQIVRISSSCRQKRGATVAPRQETIHAVLTVRRRRWPDEIIVRGSRQYTKNKDATAALWNTMFPSVEHDRCQQLVSRSLAYLIKAGEGGAVAGPEHSGNIFHQESARQKGLHEVKIGVD